MTINTQAIQQINRELSDASVIEVLEWILSTFNDDDIAMTTSFGYSGIVLLHHVLQVKPDIRLYFINTRFHFDETLEFCEYMQDLWKLNLKIITPQISKEDLQDDLGEKPYQNNPDRCCNYNKVMPLVRQLSGNKVWLSAIRRDQSPAREHISLVEKDMRGLIKISPLYQWTSKRTWNYIENNDLPYHPLHDEDYRSIGCEPCTDPVNGDMGERDGRWPGNGKIECGIHQTAPNAV